MEPTFPHKLRAVPPAGFAALAMLWLLFLLAGCSENLGPEAGSSGTAAFQGSYDASTGEIVFRPQAPDGEAELPLLLVATGIHLDTEGLLHAQVAIRNIGNTSIPGPVAVAVRGFVPASVAPANADCVSPVDPTGPSDRGACSFDHRGTYGDDGVLAAGETSEPVEWLFHGTGGESFAFQAILMFEPEPPGSGTIGGLVFEDRNQNGQRDLGEPGIAGVSLGMLVGDHEQTAVTDEVGDYSFVLEEAGLYEVRLGVPPGLVPTTPTELVVLIVRQPNGDLSQFLHADFGLFREATTNELFITGFVYMDLNRNGLRDSSEAGVPDVGIAASGLLCLSPIAAFTRTDANGSYRLRGSDIHCPLPWIVRREQVLGFTGTTPEQVILEAPPPDGSATFHVDFGLALSMEFGDPSELIGWVTVSSAAFSPGERVQIVVGLRNPTKRPIIAGFTSGCMLMFQVKSGSDVVATPGYACPANAPTYQLAPGDALAKSFSWSGTTDAGEPLAPGEYQVCSDGFLVPAVAPVTIRILAP